MLTQEYVKKIFDYDTESGILTNKIYRSSNSPAGSRAGAFDHYGYRQLTVKGRNYKEHRIIYLWMTGAMPVHGIDHINGIKDDNRWINLRDATTSENMRNRKMSSNNTSGFTGVVWFKPIKKWFASVEMLGKKHSLGYFDDINEAAKVVHVFKMKNGFTARHGIEK